MPANSIHLYSILDQCPGPDGIANRENSRQLICKMQSALSQSPLPRNPIQCELRPHKSLPLLPDLASSSASDWLLQPVAQRAGTYPCSTPWCSNEQYSPVDNYLKNYHSWWSKYPHWFEDGRSVYGLKTATSSTFHSLNVRVGVRKSVLGGWLMTLLW
jgi:hypothetical protein